MNKLLRNALLASVGFASPIALCTAAHAAAPSEMLFILDGSGSMWARSTA